MSKKGPTLPVFLTAQTLLDGDVVFWTGQAWSADFKDACLAGSLEEAEVLAAKAARLVNDPQVVDAALIPVTVVGGVGPVPTHIRERIRVLGPTTRRDLGKQAEARTGAVHHVSL